MHIAKQNLIEKLAAFDDDFMIQVLEGETPSVSEKSNALFVKPS